MASYFEKHIEELYNEGMQAYYKALTTYKEEYAKLLQEIPIMHKDIFDFFNNSQEPKQLYLKKLAFFKSIYHLRILRKELVFLRPPIIEDIKYRFLTNINYNDKVFQTVPDDLPLRFHGTPIYFVRDILKSGEISSSYDRFGFATSPDSPGEISVTTKENLIVTLDYINFDDYHLPASCIFVIHAQDMQDTYNDWSVKMFNVNFKEKPEYLYGIITTPENLEVVRSWCQEFGIDPNKVHDFNSFLNLFGDERKRHASKCHQNLHID